LKIPTTSGTQRNTTLERYVLRMDATIKLEPHGVLIGVSSAM
jgi:hypothetical protein